jgi:hypothetical protein
LTALVGGLAGLGYTAHCALEAQSSGYSRLQNILSLLRSCGTSIHDLSRVSLSGPFETPRFNMPFELGLAFSIGQQTAHRIFVFEESPFRVQTSLSDLNGFDPFVHGGSVEGIVDCLLDCFATPNRKTPTTEALVKTVQLLEKTVAKILAGKKDRSLFRPHIFRQMVVAAAEIARLRGLAD